MVDREIDVAAADGARLHVQVTGAGPPLLLVHGTAASSDAWAFVQPQLADHFTVWAYDRRGRGNSGDTGQWSYAAEAEDVRAVAAATGTAPHVVSHSFGAYCALDAAASGVAMRSLLCYEIPAHQDRRDEAVRRALARMDAGDDDGAMAIFLPEVAGLSADEVELLRSVPDVWAQLVATAPTVRREVIAVAERPWNAERYGAVDVPCCYVTGPLTESPVYVSPAEFTDAVAHATCVSLAGQRHVAMVTDPDAFATAVLDFVTTTV